MQARGADKPVTFGDYARQALATDRFSTEEPEVHYQKLSFGFYGEIGSLLSALKKARRDQLEVTEQEQARIELGDALWYLTSLARLCRVSADEMGQAAYSSLRVLMGEGRSRCRGPIRLNRLHRLAVSRAPQLTRQKDALLRQAGSQAGHLVSYDWRFVSGQPKEWLSAIFGDCLAQIVLLCVAFQLNLRDVATANLDKIFDRWPTPARRKYVLPPRKGYPWEQFEPKYVVTFRERPPGSKRVIQQIRGLNIGDPLTDNVDPGDGYRFHDVFHFAYAAHLGWSPVIRALLKLKRKSDKKVDENEDGARAVIIEEGIATWIFNDAKRRNFYSGIQPQRMDWAILQQVRSMVQGFEVRDVPLWQWEAAILDGFRVFRKLHDNRGGVVTVDIANHALRYDPLPSDDT